MPNINTTETKRSRSFPKVPIFLGLLLLLLGISLVGVAWTMGNQFALLHQKGVESVASITQIRQFTTGSGSTTKTQFEVQLSLQNGSQLKGMIPENDGKGLGAGQNITIVYVPDAKPANFVIGDLDSIAKMEDRLRWGFYAGWATLFLGFSMFVLTILRQVLGEN